MYILQRHRHTTTYSPLFQGLGDLLRFSGRRPVFVRSICQARGALQIPPRLCDWRGPYSRWCLDPGRAPWVSRWKMHYSHFLSPATGHRPPATGHRPPAHRLTGHRPPATCSPATGHLLTGSPATGHLLTGSPATGHLLTGSPATGHPPPATGHRSPTTGHRLTGHRLTATCHQLTDHGPPAHWSLAHWPQAHRYPAGHRPRHASADSLYIDYHHRHRNTSHRPGTTSNRAPGNRTTTSPHASFMLSWFDLVTFTDAFPRVRTCFTTRFSCIVMGASYLGISAVVLRKSSNQRICRTCSFHTVTKCN